MSEPKLKLYSDAHCVSERPEISQIAGRRVAVTGRARDDAGDWIYTVYDPTNESAQTFVCRETELVPTSSIPLISDKERLHNIVDQTAGLRFSVASDGLRRLLRERGIDPLKCLQISCDPGNEVNITLLLPDGSIVSADYRLDRETRQAASFNGWTFENYSDREIELCREILSQSDTSEFDADVRRCFEMNLAARDRPLPPCSSAY
jgi:hypothetical protein